MSKNNMRLVAMAPSGSSYVTQREADESLWLVHPEGSDETEQLTANDLAMAITFHNFMEVDAPWEFPKLIEQRVNELAENAELEEIETTVEDVRRFLRTLAEDATDPALTEAVLGETSAYFDLLGVLEDECLAVELRRIRAVARQTSERTDSYMARPAVQPVLSPSRARWRELSATLQVLART